MTDQPTTRAEPVSPRERCCNGPVTQPELMASIERLRVASRQLKQHERLIVQEEIEEVRWLAEKLDPATPQPAREAWDVWDFVNRTDIAILAVFNARVLDAVCAWRDVSSRLAEVLPARGLSLVNSAESTAASAYVSDLEREADAGWAQSLGGGEGGEVSEKKLPTFYDVLGIYKDDGDPTPTREPEVTEAMTVAPLDVREAFAAYQRDASAGYENTKKWALLAEHTEGSLWAAFFNGWVRGHASRSGDGSATDTERLDWLLANAYKAVSPDDFVDSMVQFAYHGNDGRAAIDEEMRRSREGE